MNNLNVYIYLYYPKHMFNKRYDDWINMLLWDINTHPLLVELIQHQKRDFIISKHHI